LLVVSIIIIVCILKTTRSTAIGVAGKRLFNTTIGVAGKR